MAQMVKRLPAVLETQVQSLGGEDPLEKEMSTSLLSWRIPWTEEPRGLQSMGLQRVDTTERLHFHFLFILQLKKENTWRKGKSHKAARKQL